MDTWRRMVVFSIILLLNNCNKNEQQNQPPAPPKPTFSKPSWDPVTYNILSRKPNYTSVDIYQILITYEQPSPRFKEQDIKTQKDAAMLVKKITADLKKTNKNKRLNKFKQYMKKYSDDPETGPQALPLTIKPDAIASVTKQMSLRLKPGEIGVAQSYLGYHIILRTPKKLPKPVLMSKEILKRPKQNGSIQYKQIIIGWRDLRSSYDGDMTKEGSKRSRQKAYELAKKILEDIKKGVSLDNYKEISEKLPTVKIMKHFHGKRPKVNIPIVKELVSRMKINEVGVVTSPFGYHIIKRIK